MTAIAIDIDGVLANFTRAFTEVAHTLFPDHAPLLNEWEAESWDYKDWYAGGGEVGECVVETTWQYILDYPLFWRTLPPLFSDDLAGWDRLRKEYREHPFVFVTRRDGGSLAWEMTVTWLRERGLMEPMVYRTRSGEEKSDVCRKLGIPVMIEDGPKNIELLLDAGIGVVLVQWPYNEYLLARQAPNLIAVTTLSEALDKAVEMAYNKERHEAVRVGCLPSRRD